MLSLLIASSFDLLSWQTKHKNTHKLSEPNMYIIHNMFIIFQLYKACIVLKSPKLAAEKVR